MNTLLTGYLTEMSCIKEFTKKGIIVSIPSIPVKYDFIIDINGKLLKVQCKTCRFNEVNNTIKFRCTSALGTQRKKIKKYTSDEIDYFCTFFNDNVYLISVNECSIEKTIHLDIPKNNQIKGITFAKDCNLDVFIESISR